MCIRDSLSEDRAPESPGKDSPGGVAAKAAGVTALGGPEGVLWGCSVVCSVDGGCVEFGVLVVVVIRALLVSQCAEEEAGGSASRPVGTAGEGGVEEGGW
eukprot:4379983-Prorocentrum_lima.AAC.1